MRIKLVILLIGLTLSCKNGGGTVGENIEGSLELGQKESAVVSTLIDEISFPLPLPPPPDDGNFELFQKRLDSLELVKMKILIDTTLIPIDDSLRLPKEYAAFQPLADRIPQLEQTVLNPEYVKSQEGHSLDFGGSPEEMEGDVELQLRFSSVA